MTPREKVIQLVRAIDDAGTPLATFRALSGIIKAWHQPPVGDKSQIGAGTCGVLMRLVAARDAYEAAIRDAKNILEIR